MCSRLLGEAITWGCPSSKNEKPEPSPAPLKMLELSSSMHPQYISFQIFQALESSAYNALSCHGLDMIPAENQDVELGEASPTSYVKYLKALIHSRKWLRVEFHRCRGVEYLICPIESKMEVNCEKGFQQTAGVDTLLLKMPRCAPITSGSYDEERHRNFFANLWKWKVQKLSLSMDFTPEWTNEFCRHEVSALKELEINPECKFHRYDDSNQTTNEADSVNDMDCWQLFCRELRGNHPHLNSLSIYCKTSDNDLAYLIDHAISPASFVDPNSKTPSAVLPLQTLFFSKLCSCDEKSLLALSRVLNSSSGQKFQSLNISRGVKLPSRSSLNAGLSLPPRPPDRHGLLEFCRSLQYATALTKLTMGDFIFDELEMSALFDSLVLASGKIEKLSLFDSAATSNEVYEKVLCGGAISDISPKSPSCLIQNQLPNLRFVHFPREALKALLEVLRYNTSIEWINASFRTKTHEYYLDLNRGGRRILTSSAGAKDGSSKISPTLWPQILERASSDLRTELRRDRYCGGEKRKYDVVYNLLRNQILLEL